MRCRSLTRRSVFAVAGALVFVLARAAAAETIQLSVEGALSERLVSLDVFEREGVRYVSLRSLIEQSGGAFSVLPTQARVDLDGETAYVRAGHDRVNALSIFSLSRPIVQDGEFLLIAVDDLVTFFQKSFRKNVRPVGTGVTMPIAPSPGTHRAPTGPRVVDVPREPGELEGLGLKPSPAPRVPGEYRTLVIDPGHGGSDTGGQAGEAVSEDELALALSKLIKARITTNGEVRALLTREADSDLTGSQRQSSILAVRPDFVISIHLGTSLSPAVQGIATFYPPPTTISTGGLLSGGVTTATIGEEVSAESRRLARAVGASLAKTTGAPLRGVIAAPIRTMDDLGVPSILVEVGCLSAPDAATLMDPVQQTRIAEGIANGINAFVARQEVVVEGDAPVGNQPEEITPAATSSPEPAEPEAN